MLWANLQKQVTVSSTSNGNIIWPLAERPWIAIDEYRTLDSVFDALLLLPPTMVLSTFDVHINDDLLSLCLRRELFFFFFSILCIFISFSFWWCGFFVLLFRSLDSFNTKPWLYSTFGKNDFDASLIWFQSFSKLFYTKRKLCMAKCAWGTFTFSIPEKEQKKKREKQ